jgi:hypothetical protein
MDFELLYLIVIKSGYNNSANKSNQPIQNPLLLVTEPRTRGNTMPNVSQACDNKFQLFLIFPNASFDFVQSLSGENTNIILLKLID